MSTTNKCCNIETPKTQCCNNNNYLIVLVVFILLAIILGSYFVL